jgi:hypothetical protein
MNAANSKRSNALPLTPERAAEFRRLLDGAALTATDELLLHGTALEVVVSVWESEDPQGHFDAHVSAFEPGGKRVRLDGAALHAVGRDEVGTVLRVGRSTERGDLSLDGLPVGLRYELHSPALVGRSSQPVKLPVRDQKWAAQGAEEPAPRPWELPVYETTDGKVKARVAPLPDGTTEFVFETREPSLALAVVRFALVQESGQVVHSAEADLKLVREGHWEGRWSGVVSLPSPCEFVFEVRPQD